MSAASSGRHCAEPDAKASRLRLLVVIVLVGTTASVVYHYMGRYYYGVGSPQSTFLFLPKDHFNDWDNLYIFAKGFLGGVPGPYAYYPLAILFAVASTVVPMHVGFALTVVLFLVVLAWMLKGWVVDVDEHTVDKVMHAFVLMALSYPVLFALDRGNVEVIVFVLLAGFFYFTYRHDVTWMAALLLAAAVSFKLYPATLLLLLLAERRFRTVGLFVLFALALTAVSAAIVIPLGGFSVNQFWEMSAAGKDLYQLTMVQAGGGVQHGHTLWGLLRLAALLRSWSIEGWQITAYLAVAGIFSLALAVHAILREKERWKIVLYAVVPSLLLPFVSADYTLIQLYFPLVFFLNSPRRSRWDPAYVVLFGLLLIPVDYYYPIAYGDGVSISVVVYPLAMLGLLLVALKDREPELSGGGADSVRSVP